MSDLDKLRREMFLAGFIAAKNPRTPADTLRACAEADKAYEETVGDITCATCGHPERNHQCRHPFKPQTFARKQ